MKKQRLQDLLEKQQAGSLTASEEQELTAWESGLDTQDGLFELHSNAEQRQWVENIWTAVAAKMQPQAPVRKMQWNWIKYAVAIALIIVGAGWWLVHNNYQSPTIITQVQQDILPGQQGAILTLADGRKLTLDTMKEGSLIDAGVNIQLNSGQLMYNTFSGNDRPVGYNTMTTPNGRQFIVVLPDGSKVWLNAASSLTYPTRFEDKERAVQVTGEAYFEIAKNQRLPFRVIINGNQQVEVLGTEFNVNAYTNEPVMKTTLINGQVRMRSGSEQIILHPGEQAIVDEKLAVEKNIDIGQVTAWKNGAFNLEGVTLEQLMRQLARWYDIDIKYAGKIPVVNFHGDLGRDLQLSQIREVLAQYRIKTQLNGRQLIIE